MSVHLACVCHRGSNYRKLGFQLDKPTAQICAKTVCEPQIWLQGIENTQYHIDDGATHRTKTPFVKRENCSSSRLAAYFVHVRADLGLVCTQATAIRTHVASHTVSRLLRAPGPAPSLSGLKWISSLQLLGVLACCRQAIFIFGLSSSEEVCLCSSPSEHVYTVTKPL